ncbi:hypothetical protein Scep_006623 [Stephania cephalantha]|uniref:Uncharacterized protein n=1 Tax=Stephania cephalantha TaxID=152367 RepID=A0AAP0PP82_9MAGN
MRGVVPGRLGLRWVSGGRPRPVLVTATTCGVLTVEIEHVDVATIEKLEQNGIICQPKASTIRIIQLSAVANLSQGIFADWAPQITSTDLCMQTRLCLIGLQSRTYVFIRRSNDDDVEQIKYKFELVTLKASINGEMIYTYLLFDWMEKENIPRKKDKFRGKTTFSCVPRVLRGGTRASFPANLCHLSRQVSSAISQRNSPSLVTLP